MAGLGFVFVVRAHRYDVCDDSTDNRFVWQWWHDRFTALRHHDRDVRYHVPHAVLRSLATVISLARRAWSCATTTVGLGNIVAREYPHTRRSVPGG